MRRRIPMASLLLLAAVGLAWLGARGYLLGPQVGPAPAHAADEQPAGDAALRKAALGYVEAYNRGDVDALLTFWTPDADYVDDNGQVYKGKEALGKLFRESMTNFKGSKMSGRILSLRFLKPDVAIEDGVLDLTGPNGQVNSSKYTTVWMNIKDRWLIASARDLSADPEGDAVTSATRLKELQWLIGDWAQADDADKLTLSCRWAPNKSFVVQEFQARVKDETLIVTQWVGWDPVEEQIHSWFFDSHGGHGQGLWTRTGNTWRVESNGVAPDGRTGSSINTWKFVDDGHFQWQLTDRQLDENPLPEVDVRMVRKAAK